MTQGHSTSAPGQPTGVHTLRKRTELTGAICGRNLREESAGRICRKNLDESDREIKATKTIAASKASATGDLAGAR